MAGPPGKSEVSARHGRNLVRVAAPRSRFPLALAALCGAAALALFLTGTVPALAESEQLEALEQDRAEPLQRLWTESVDLTGRHRALDSDPQAILVELDRLGLMPRDLEPIEPERR